MPERLSDERLAQIRRDSDRCNINGCASVRDLLSHIDAQDAEYEQLQYTEEMNGEIIRALRAENERLRQRISRMCAECSEGIACCGSCPLGEATNVRATE